MGLTPFTEVAVILVAYDSAAVIGRALASLPAGVEAIVVDNASSDGSAEIALAHGARVLRQDRNLGFGVACNAGAAATGRELLLFLNPDARLEPGAMESLLAAVVRHPEAAAFNPRLRRGAQQFFRWRSKLLPETAARRQPPPAADCEIEVLSGSALLCRRRAFAAVGGFDPRIFLYHEDDDLSLRLAAAGWRLRYVHQAVVQHHGGQSTRDDGGLERFKSYHALKSRRYAMAKHNVPFPWGLEMALSLWRLLGATLAGDRRQRQRQLGRIAALRE